MGEEYSLDWLMHLQFADWAEQHDDLANYLGYAEIAIFGIWKHHQSEGSSSSADPAVALLMHGADTILFPQWSKASGLVHSVFIG